MGSFNSIRDRQDAALFLDIATSSPSHPATSTLLDTVMILFPLCRLRTEYESILQSWVHGNPTELQMANEAKRFADKIHGLLPEAVM